MGTVDMLGPNPAGTVDVGVLGTGVSNTTTPFNGSNAFMPASVTPINCTGYSKANILFKFTAADYRIVTSSYTYAIFMQNQASSSDWHLSASQSLTIGTANVTQEFLTSQIIDGATGLVVLIDDIAGFSPSVSVWVELE